MEKTNRTYLLLLGIITLGTYIISQNFITTLATTTIYMGVILLTNLIIGRLSDDEVSLVNIRKIKYVKHPKSNRYFIWYDGNGKIKLYKSNLFCSNYIYTYHTTFSLDMEDLTRYLLIEIDDDIEYSSETVSKLLNNWSGALTKELERDEEINEILK